MLWRKCEMLGCDMVAAYMRGNWRTSSHKSFVFNNMRMAVN